MTENTGQQNKKPAVEVQEGDGEARQFSNPWSLSRYDTYRTRVSEAHDKNELNIRIMPQDKRLGWMNGRFFVVETGGFQLKEVPLQETPEAHKDLAVDVKDRPEDLKNKPTAPTLQDEGWIHFVAKLKDSDENAVAMSLRVLFTEDVDRKSGTVHLIRNQEPGMGMADINVEVQEGQPLSIVVGRGILDVVPGTMENLIAVVVPGKE